MKIPTAQIRALTAALPPAILAALQRSRRRSPQRGDRAVSSRDVLR
jgi:hypothetical protein